jgi:hypothetical protein
MEMGFSMAIDHSIKRLATLAQFLLILVSNYQTNPI